LAFFCVFRVAALRFPRYIKAFLLLLLLLLLININIYKTLTSVPSRGREGAWRKNKNKQGERGGGLAAPERASILMLV